MAVRNHYHGSRNVDGLEYAELPPFAALESMLSSTVVDALHNIHIVHGTDVIGAILDRAVEFIGEYGLTGELRDRITVLRIDAVGWASGQVIAADPATYSVGELAAMDRSTWLLDRIASDDGHVITWWLK